MKGHPGACQQTRGAAAWLHWLASALQLAHHHRTLCVALDEGCMSDQLKKQASWLSHYSDSLQLGSRDASRPCAGSGIS